MIRFRFSVFFILFTIGAPAMLMAQAPTIQDCLGAIPVCQETYTQTSVYSGYGTYNEIPGTGTCPNNCMDGEKNSVWYIVTVQTAGMMSFEIDPIMVNDDYDWGVYNLTDAECGDIYGNPSIQVACNAAGGAGYHGNTGAWTAMGGTSSCENGGNTNKWCADIPVQAGETYVICISNWTQSNEGYTLNFEGSTANIYDDVKPYINWVQETFGCSGETEMNFSFSEFVLCSTVNPSDFEIIDPTGNSLTVIDVVGDACENGGTQEMNFKLILDPSTPIIETGMHSLVINGPVADLCTNYANLEAFNFYVVTDAPYVEFSGLPANACITDSPKELVSNREQGSYSIDPDCGECLDDHGNGTATLYPSLMEVGAYAVTYYFSDGLCDNDTTKNIILSSLPEVFDLSPGGTFCSGTEGIEIILSGTESMVWYDLFRNGDYLESRMGTGNSLSYNYWDVPGNYSVQASSFCGISNMNGYCLIIEVPAPTVFDITGPEFFCENSPGAVITLTDSEPGVSYELLLDGASLSPPLTLLGVGGALDFPPQTTEGTYSVYAVKSGCDNMMNGEVTIASKPVPAPDFSVEGLCQWLPTQFTNTSGIQPPAIISAYLWDFDDNGATSSQENPSHIFSDYGDYQVSLTATSDFGCVDVVTKTVTIAEGINADAGENEEINYGTTTTLYGSASGGSGDYSYHWEPASLVENPNAASTMTHILYNAQTFTLTVHDSESACYGESAVDISLKGGPLRAEPSASAPFVCSGEGITLHANAAGGSENYVYTWYSDPDKYEFDVSDPTIPSLTEAYTFYVKVEDGYSDIVASVPVSVKDNPDVYAGHDIEIPYEYYTLLECIVNGGGSSFDYTWSPADKIDGSNLIQNPKTIPLISNQVFSVIVTNEFGCQGSDDVKVSVDGGPLTTAAYAENPVICQFDSLFLFSSVSGGGKPWRFEWWVEPGNFTSDEENPAIVVSDTGNYIYHVVVYDQQNRDSADISVRVNPSPFLNLAYGFDSIVESPQGDTLAVAVCIFDTVYLDAGNPGFHYVWSTGSTDQMIQAATTGIGTDLRSYYVDVFDPVTGCATSDSIAIIFSFAMCTYSIDELNGQSLDVVLYPNPVNNNLNVRVKGLQKPTEIMITDVTGKTCLYRMSVPYGHDTWEHSFCFDAFPPGTYLVTFISGGAVHSGKVVKSYPFN